MSKIIYIVDNNDKTEYKYNICEDTVIYHFSINIIYLFIQNYSCKV